VTKNDLEYKDVGRGFKRAAEVMGARTVRVYISIPFGGFVEFGYSLTLDSGAWVYKPDEILAIGGQWDPTDDVEIKLIELT